MARTSASREAPSDTRRHEKKAPVTTAKSTAKKAPAKKAPCQGRRQEGAGREGSGQGRRPRRPAPAEKAPAEGRRPRRGGHTAPPRRPPPRRRPPRRRPRRPLRPRRRPARRPRRRRRARQEGRPGQGRRPRRPRPRRPRRPRPRRRRRRRRPAKVKSPFDAKFLDAAARRCSSRSGPSLHHADVLRPRPTSWPRPRARRRAVRRGVGRGRHPPRRARRDLALSAQARLQVEEIDRALPKIDAGTYGICEVSGVPIPKERLEAIPWARERVEYKVGGFGRR